MENGNFKTPILLIVFARPDLSAIVFEEIRKVKPRQLFVAGDGGRSPQEWVKCKEARRIIEKVDWPCEVKTFFGEKNLGCKYGVSAAITWFFENVEEGIILEDDCLPDPSFLPYCAELLDKYRHNERVMHISGDNFQQNNHNFSCADSYYFSHIMHEWGWATWRRAWNKYDITMSKWREAKENKLLCKLFTNSADAYRWGKLFDQHADIKYEKELAAWDGQWGFACLYHNGLCINPGTNLVSNIGFRSDARRTNNPSDELANLPTYPVQIPLQHPENILVDEKADRYTHKYIFNINRYLGQRIKWLLKSKFTKPYLQLKKMYFRIFLKRSFDDGEKLLIC